MYRARLECWELLLYAELCTTNRTSSNSLLLALWHFHSSEDKGLVHPVRNQLLVFYHSNLM